MNAIATAITPVDSIATHPVVTAACQVMGITPLSAETYQVELQASAGTVLGYYAGQYLQLEVDVNGDGQLQTLSYSIANSFDPQQPRRLQLFIQQGSEFAAKILKRLAQLNQNHESVKVILPMGQAFLQTNLDFPHILVAAGSGISKIKCITEEILRQKPDADIKIYWSNKSSSDFYLLDKFQEWATKHNNLGFIPILESANTDWSGRSGYIYEVIQSDIERLDSVNAYLCGSPQMVYGTIDKLKIIGLKEENCYSDVFEYAPRG